MEENVQVKLREEVSRLSNLIQVLENLEKVPEWKLLKSLILDSLVEKIRVRIYMESTKDEIDPKELYRLQGELMWAKRYADLNGYAGTLKKELELVKKRLT